MFGRDITFLMDETMKVKVNVKLIREKLELVERSFEKTLYEDDDTFMKNMKNNNLKGDDINHYRHWEWPQGVGLFGLWKKFEISKDKKYLNIIIQYYEKQMEVGFPSKNINTTAPMLALAYLYEYTGDKKYEKVCIEWAQWLITDLPRTKEGGFQHLTSDTLNNNELWDDTLFMAVLFLAKTGIVADRPEWAEEAKYQFLLHIKYLTDRKTGLWFHGWTFNGNHNFAKALWGRGNCWITIAIPEFLSVVECEEGVKKFLIETFRRQILAMEKFQDSSGMWHTLLDDDTSYLEASATCGIAYGILKAVHMGIINPKYKACAQRAIEPVLNCINQDGIVEQVSYGTCMGRETKQYYKEVKLKSMPYGQAFAMLFLLEAMI
jgi:unsaturated rhamnogalacturonyl hydrolase